MGNKLKKVGKIALIVLLSLGTVWSIIHFVPPTKVAEVNPWIATERTFISAHRGGAELNPENTEMAFDYVINETTYTDMVEIDIHKTKDGVLVINHDTTINRVALEEGSEEITISEKTYSELLNYNLGKNFVARDGSKPYTNLSISEAEEKGLTIMTLEDFLTKYKEARDFKLLLEIKDEGTVANDVTDEVQKLFSTEKYAWWKDRTMIISFTNSVIDYITENYPEQYVAPLGYKIATQLIFQFLGLDCLSSPKYHGFQTQMTNSAGPLTLNCATKRMVNGCHRRNQAITYWTINNEEDMQTLMDIGADMITTNAPDKLAKLQGLI